MKLAFALLCSVPLISCTASAEPNAHIVVQHSALAGFRYYAGRALWSEMRPGDPLTLVREPGNPHDAHAVRVEWRGQTIGYVARGDNKHLARQLDHGVRLEARVTRLDKSRNGRNRVSYEVLVPLD